MPTPTPLHAHRLSKYGLIAAVSILASWATFWSCSHQDYVCTFSIKDSANSQVQAPAEASSPAQRVEEKGLYAPRIIVEPEWKHHRHQVFMIVRQAGAAASVVDPVWISKESVHLLDRTAAEYVEVSSLQKAHARQPRRASMYRDCP